MTVFQPFLFLAAFLALSAAGFWWSVADVAEKHGGDAARVNRRVRLAAISTAIVLALASGAVLLPPVVGLFL